MVLGRVRIGSFDLYEALGAYWLVATACLIEIRWVEHEANWTFLSILVQKRLGSLPIDIGIFR
jgi:hypothetical protein